MAAKQQTTPQSYAEFTEEYTRLAERLVEMHKQVPAALVPQKQLKTMRGTVKDWVDQVSVEVSDIAIRLGEATAAYGQPAEPEGAAAEKPAAKTPAKKGGAAAKKPAAKGGKRQPAGAAA